MIGKLVIIGEAPGAETIRAHPERALLGSSGQNLVTIAGWEWERYVSETERYNLFLDPQPMWYFKRAFASARELTRQLEGRTIILLGAKVATAFDLLREPNYQWLHEDWANVAKVPHPSGKNRMWNDPAERAKAREFLNGLIR